MGYRVGNRDQTTMFPSSIDEYVGSDHPVRVYDALIDAMDIPSLELKDKKIGCPAYDPRAMLKVLVYSYSYGWRSSRKIERALYDNVSFIWLSGGLKPDHKTIANFRRDNKQLLTDTLKATARMCVKLDLIVGNVLFIDGTKMRGNSSINKHKSQSGLKKYIAKIDENIEKLLSSSEGIDNAESGSLVSVNKGLQDKRELKKKIEATLEIMNQEDKQRMNSTDPDCIAFRSRQGVHSGYNAHIVTDEKHGLIVSSKVANTMNDYGQFSENIASANEVLGSPCETAVADAGYADVKDLKTSADEGIKVIVPNQKQAAHKPKDEPFGKDKFTYDASMDEYICPAGKRLGCKGYNKKSNNYRYNIKKISDCLNCVHYGDCTKSKTGRNICRLVNEDLKDTLAKIYDSDEGQRIYARRKEVAELPFGHIKRNLSAGHFLMRGIDKCNAEMALLSSCFNLRRMITLLGGVKNTINAVKAMA